MKSEKLYALFIGLFTFVLVIFAASVPIRTLREKALDQQTESALLEVSTTLSSYISGNNGKLPSSVTDLDFSNSELNKDSKVLSRITIEGDENDYKLCGDFYTDTKQDDQKLLTDINVGTIAQSYLSPSSYSEYSVHDKGKYCFDNSYDNYPYNVPGSSNTYTDGVDLQNSYSASDNQDDAERRAEINSIFSQAEVYFAENGIYPSFSEMNDSAFRSKMQGITDETFTDPLGYDSKFSSTPQANTYSYQPSPENCDNSSTDCTDYSLTAVLSDGKNYTKKSLSN